MQDMGELIYILDYDAPKAVADENERPIWLGYVSVACIAGELVRSEENRVQHLGASKRDH